MAISTKSSLKIKIFNMKSIANLIVVVITLLVVACNSQPSNMVTIGNFTAADSANFTKIQWLDSVVNFGSIQMGESKTVTFRLKNIGNKPSAKNPTY
jgi:hypothetical protein